MSPAANTCGWLTERRYLSTWMKPSIYGEKPRDGLTAALLKDADEETRELLGIAGYM